MNAEILLKHFARISEAPDAIPRLRQFILDLAVRGKLVEQNPDDEPAVELIRRIEAVRVRPGGNAIPNMKEPGEVPFSLPGTWKWIRIAEGFRYDCGVKRDPGDLNPDWWLLELEDIEKDSSVVRVRMAVRDRDSLSTKSEFKAGDILYGKLRPYLNKVVVATEPGYSTTEIVAIRPYVGLCPAYCAIAFRRPDFVDYVSRLGRGTKMPRLRTPDAIVAPFPLPPIAEQFRIAKKVEELTALCDRLEEAQKQREAQRARVTAASIHHLNAADHGGSLRRNSLFFINHLPQLTARPEQIKQIRQTILNFAVRGLLVSQDAADEPAVNLMQRLQAEKARLQSKGELRTKSPLSQVNSRHPPFQLPKGWLCARWGEVANKIGDIDHKMPDTVPDGIPYISPRDFRPNGCIDFEGAKRISRADYERLAAKMTPTVGDLIYPRYGTIGENRLVVTQREFLVSYSCAVVKVMHGFVDPQFQYIFSMSDICRAQAKAAENKATQANVGIKSIQEFLFLLPPLAEQRRIVARVTELMTLCNQLEDQLSLIQGDSYCLLESVLQESLAPLAARRCDNFIAQSLEVQ